MTKYRLQSLLFVFVAFMLGCNEYMIVGVLPDIAKEFHASLSSLGYTVTLFALIYAISTPIVTTLASRFNRYHVLLVLLLNRQYLDGAGNGILVIDGFESAYGDGSRGYYLVSTGHGQLYCTAR